MKKITLLTIFLGFISCAPVKEIYPVEVLFGVDFRPYTQKGFLFTPEKYTGEYESIGLLDLSRSPGAQYVILNSKANPRFSRFSSEQEVFYQYGWKIDSISIPMMIDKFYSICIDMGADAVMNFEVYGKEALRVQPVFSNKNPPELPFLGIRGFAIKRKD